MERKLNCVLLIDDDEPTNFLNQIIIESSGCAEEIKTAQSGREALEYLMQTIQIKLFPVLISFFSTSTCPQ